MLAVFLTDMKYNQNCFWTQNPTDLQKLIVVPEKMVYDQDENAKSAREGKEEIAAVTETGATGGR